MMTTETENLSIEKSISNEWPETGKQSVTSDSDETTLFEPDDESKIKPEVELKEETENFVYKADFRGHLQLVSVPEIISSQCKNAENCHSVEEPSKASLRNSFTFEAPNKDFHKENADSSENNEYTIPNERRSWSIAEPSIPLQDDNNQQPVVNWSHQPSDGNIYRQLKSVSENSSEDSYYIKEEPPDNSPQRYTYVHTLPEIYDYSPDSTWEPSGESSSQLTGKLPLDSSTLLLTQAEKKRLYRMRIKEENPDMWSNIKKREAARKREQREKRRQVLCEMQKAMDALSLPDSSEAQNQRMYLEALKERYPDLWNQLISAIPATDLRNEQLFLGQGGRGRRHAPKPARLYKDVIEAQKKRVYRQRMKEERPEMYERQKAREAYSRSIQRLAQKRKQNGCSLEGLHPDEVEKKLTYLQNLQVENLQYLQPHRPPPYFIEGLLSDSTSSPPKSELSPVCDSSCSEDIDKNPTISTSDRNISNQDKDPVSSSEVSCTRNLSAACSKQSDILWYWNDVRAHQCYENLPIETSTIPYVPWRKGPQVLSEDERLEKITRERDSLREKRRLYRMKMSPEKRVEFLEVERERLKTYRVKKKISVEYPDQKDIPCPDQ